MSQLVSLSQLCRFTVSIHMSRTNFYCTRYLNFSKLVVLSVMMNLFKVQYHSRSRSGRVVREANLPRRQCSQGQRCGFESYAPWWSIWTTRLVHCVIACCPWTRRLARIGSQGLSCWKGSLAQIHIHHTQFYITVHSDIWDNWKLYRMVDGIDFRYRRIVMKFMERKKHR